MSLWEYNRENGFDEGWQMSDREGVDREGAAGPPQSCDGEKLEQWAMREEVARSQRDQNTGHA